MSKKQNKKFITPEILRGAVKGAFVKLNQIGRADV